MNQPDGTVGVRSDARPRAGRWPYACAWTLIFAVVAALALENLDGYHNEVGFRIDHYASEAPYINWTHGWPLYAFIRSSPQPANRTPPPKSIPGGFAINSRWPIDAAPWRHFRPWALAADLAICGVVLAGTAFMLLRWANQLTRRPRYGLRTLIFYIGMSAVALVFINRDVAGALEATRYASELDFNGTNARFFTHAGALIAITFGGVLTIVAVFELARTALAWAYVRRRRVAATPSQ